VIYLIASSKERVKNSFWDERRNDGIFEPRLQAFLGLDDTDNQLSSIQESMKAAAVMENQNDNQFRGKGVSS
jgi:hypothetical protein